MHLLAPKLLDTEVRHPSNSRSNLCADIHIGQIDFVPYLNEEELQDTGFGHQFPFAGARTYTVISVGGGETAERAVAVRTAPVVS